MTAAQVIGLGEYLNPEFDPATLTVAQLLGVLGYHNIRFPTPYTKPKLVQLFLDEVKPKAAKFKKDRLKKENSAASDDGITDGMTGKPLGGATKVLPLYSYRASSLLLTSFSQGGLPGDSLVHRRMMMNHRLDLIRYGPHFPCHAHAHPNLVFLSRSAVARRRNQALVEHIQLLLAPPCSLQSSRKVNLKKSHPCVR
jgi:hypothetical protein